MAFKIWLMGMNKKKGPLTIDASENGALAMYEQSGQFENFFHEKSTITTGTPKTYECHHLIKRQCTSGYISNDSNAVELEVNINENQGKVWIEPKEILDLTGSNARKIIITSSGTNIPYRILIK